MCSGCWDNLDCDERAEAIVEHEHGGVRERIVYRDRPVTPAAPVRPNHRELSVLRDEATVGVGSDARLNRSPGSSCCSAREFSPVANGSTRCGSYRTYGIELETSSCPNAADLNGKTVFSSSSDGSIDGWEFNSEVLNGDAGLDEVERFCELAEENSFAVDSKCGFHAHFGVRDLSDEQRYNVALAYYFTESIWSAFVSKARRATHYCAAIQWRPVVYGGTVSRIEYKVYNDTTRRDEVKNAVIRAEGDGDEENTPYKDFAEKIDRYCWFNVRSFEEHETIELRLHPGTISAKKVNNWIIAHLRFIELVANMSREAIVREFHGKADTTLFAGLLELMPADVATYLTQRAEQFGTIFATEPAAELQPA